MRHKKKIALVLALALFALVIVGCGAPDVEEMEEIEQEEIEQMEEESFDEGAEEDFDPFEEEPMDGEEEPIEEDF
ncbi:hypothetical protein [Fuchsiella alkaliacetigena]|uniref:hypothetical protein n=1 Tax=Fuchsiella alkaliacetigena TaxID=957042 RepID=UPI00200A5478|nr:hypothetical protein [Fuchsiella alkaliacetigena]MCK8823719.1 hypothetical protein [Fuchsiella alkaliacetigena]